MPKLKPGGSADHLDSLLQQEKEYKRMLQLLHDCQIAAVSMRHRQREYYGTAVVRLDQINKHKRVLQEELYNAIMSNDPKRLARAEKKLRAVAEEQHVVQLDLPGRLKGYAVAIRREADVGEALREARAKLARKQEELHVLRPCAALRCEHCRPKGTRDERKRQAAQSGPTYGAVDRVAKRLFGQVMRGIKSVRR